VVRWFKFGSELVPVSSLVPLVRLVRWISFGSLDLDLDSLVLDLVRLVRWFALVRCSSLVVGSLVSVGLNLVGFRYVSSGSLDRCKGFNLSLSLNLVR
jgi:hypothetical protein